MIVAYNTSQSFAQCVIVALLVELKLIILDSFRQWKDRLNTVTPCRVVGMWYDSLYIKKLFGDEQQGTCSATSCMELSSAMLFV